MMLKDALRSWSFVVLSNLPEERSFDTIMQNAFAFWFKRYQMRPG